MRDYIAEANRFMYDDNYSEMINEGKYTLHGKEYPSKNAAKEVLIRKGFKGKKLIDELELGEFVGSAKDIVKKKADNKMSSDKMRDEDSPHGGHLDKSENALDAHDDDDEGEYDEYVQKHGYDKTAHRKLHNEVDKLHKSGKEIPNNMLSKLKDHTQKSINVLHRVEPKKSSKVSSVKDVVNMLGPRGKASEEKVIAFLKKNKINDELSASVIGHYGIDGEEYFDDNGNWK